MDGVREYESPAHAPRFPYRLGTHGTVWGFGLTLTNMVPVQGLKSMASPQYGHVRRRHLSEKDEVVGPIGPRAISLGRTAYIPPPFSVKVIVYNDSW